MHKELNAFLQQWTVDPKGVKAVFTAMRRRLEGMDGVSLEYRGRPGVSHSLRALRKDAARPLFVLIDIIDDQPEERWLSVCFYADLTSDPEERGDIVPGGLLGEDALCFDIAPDQSKTGGETKGQTGGETGRVLQAYMLERLEEAAINCAKNAAQ
ncbi:hypothetical protein LJC59_04875 [Desulfovibrio sp. OttesenSCG-928-A18]|nr:hypothetical protein [Desulfovibrio sp. OttesenSCG-928-A18]